MWPHSYYHSTWTAEIGGLNSRPALSTKWVCGRLHKVLSQKIEEKTGFEPNIQQNAWVPFPVSYSDCVHIFRCQRSSQACLSSSSRQASCSYHVMITTVAAPWACRVSCPPLQGRSTIASSGYVHAGDLNSGPHTCIVGASLSLSLFGDRALHAAFTVLELCRPNWSWG